MKKLFLLLIPVFLCLGMIRLFTGHNELLPTSDEFAYMWSNLPNLRQELIDDLKLTQEKFQNFRQPATPVFNLVAPTFNASSFNSFFSSIGSYFTYFGKAIINGISALGESFSHFFDIFGSICYSIIHTFINVIGWILSLIYIIFGL